MSISLPQLGLEVPVTSPNLPVYRDVSQEVLATPPVPLGPRVQSGTVAFASNGQVVVLPEPYSISMQVVVQGTSNAAGVNGFFTVATYGSLNQFQIFYSGELSFGPIEVFYIAVGL